jgi:putative ABC transport system ATP-binding protein
MIVLRNIRKVFNAGRPNEFVAVDGVSLEITRGTLTILRGPSGSGKTTLLSLIGCMARPTSGRIDLSDREITSMPERFLAEIRRGTFGFVFQRFHLLNGISVRENIILPALPLGEDLKELHARADRLLARFGMTGRAHAKVQWLSGGESQRVALCRALINDPEYFIADEPTSHLDRALSHEFMQHVRTLKSEGRTIIIASHDPLVCDTPDADQVIEMRDGRMIAGEC